MLFSRFVKLYTLNIYKILYVNYTSKVIFFNVIYYINMSNIFIYILSLKKKQKRIKAVGPDGGG